MFLMGLSLMAFDNNDRIVVVGGGGAIYEARGMPAVLSKILKGKMPGRYRITERGRPE